MLQQTVVTAAVAPFQAWMDRWPNLASLAAAEEDAVLRAWEGLGYASRAKNLHRAARRLITQGKTTLPDSEDELRALPGVGEYTAAAILSFAFHRPTLTLDANLKRVFQRLDAAEVWSKGVEARWRTLWSALVDGPSSRESNQALMQLGQRVCRAKSPLCGVCPLAVGCRAREEGIVGRIPELRPKAIFEKNTAVMFWYRGEDAEAWWLVQPRVGRFSNLWMAPPWDPAEESAGKYRRLTGRIHSYTKYRDRLTPLAARWTGTAQPPLPSGWIGRWATPAEAKGLGMVSVYRRILEEAMELTLL
jgi:A/G-specific adenine glycosylase